MRLPDMDSVSLIGELAALPRAPALIASGTLNHAFQVLPAQQAGAGGFLLKPFRKERVKASIAKALSARNCETRRSEWGRSFPKAG
jgi:DNA-binding NarL/FixJ family response regulator